MLGMAKRVHARILQASTSEIYGDPLEHPQTESYFGNVNPIGPRSCYDEGKRVAETLMMDYHRQNGVDTRIIRIFNTYGERMMEDDGRVVSNFIVQALRNEDLTVYGDGSQTRSFCYVSDLVEGMVRAMEAGADDIHMPINLGNPGEFTMNELADEVGRAAAREVKIKYLPLPQDDPKQRQPNIDRARKLLGWEPKVALADGLKKTVEYFRSVTGENIMQKPAR
ncbi:MAG: GDP-mannose 4,6-dehydratase [Chloracidobacterium sp.]|nr:GDP-mannose 4,6-dehydratase [Chloracidobacterium sp.]